MQEAEAIQSPWERKSASAMAIVLYDAQYREADEVWEGSGIAVEEKVVRVVTFNR